MSVRDDCVRDQWYLTALSDELGMFIQVYALAVKNILRRCEGKCVEKMAGGRK